MCELRVGACNHPSSCSPTSHFCAHSDCQRVSTRAHIICHCARQHSAVLANGTSCSAYRSPRTPNRPAARTPARSSALECAEHPAQRAAVDMSVNAQRHTGGQHDLDQAISMGRRRRSDRGRRLWRRRCYCCQLNRRKLHRRARDDGTRQAHQLLAPRVQLTRADPVFPGDLGCGQVRTEALGDDLALLLGRPRPPRFSPRQNLDASRTSTPMISRTSALRFRDQVRRHHIHMRTGS
jgi:hypothetical protein